MPYSMDDMLRPANSVTSSTRVEGANEALAGHALAHFLSSLVIVERDGKPIAEILPKALEVVNAELAKLETELRAIEGNDQLDIAEIEALAQAQFESSYGSPALINDALCYLKGAAEMHGANTWLNPADSHGVARHRQRKVALFAIRPLVDAGSHRQIDKAISLCKC